MSWYQDAVIYEAHVRAFYDRNGDGIGDCTPMPSSSDRNAGCSRADPARLYAPVIMDPVCGYQSIQPVVTPLSAAS